MLLEVRAEHRGAGLAAALGLPACRDGLAQLREAVGHALPVRVGILTILPDCTSSRFSAAEFSKSYAGSLGLLGSYLAGYKLLQKVFRALDRYRAHAEPCATV
jgi:hypothetical protein